jgi:TPR repeat protein
MRQHILAVSFAFSLSLTAAAAEGVAQLDSETFPSYSCRLNDTYQAALQPCDATAVQSVASYNLGLMYEKGLGGGQNYGEAVRLFRKAADGGVENALIKLGWMYWQGLGVTQNYTEAFRWYHTAAVQGNFIAQNALGVMYQYGQGPTRNYVLAHMWYNISASHNAYELAADNRNRVAALMTPQQIAEAQTGAQRCLDSNYTDC